MWDFSWNWRNFVFIAYAIMAYLMFTGQWSLTT